MRAQALPKIYGLQLTPLLTAGVGLLTSGGTGFNKGDALCILSAAIFGLHKFRTESITQRFDDTQELVAVQLVVLSTCSALATLPALYQLLPNSSPGVLGTGQLYAAELDTQLSLCLSLCLSW